MTPLATDWNGVALAKLTNVLGEKAGRALMAETLAKLGLAEIQTSRELRAFARALSAIDGFASAIGGMLAVHATMYGEPDDRESSAAL